MSKKKRVILSWIPPDLFVVAMQNMGVLNQHGRGTGKVNVNDWITRQIGKGIGIENIQDNQQFQEKVIVDEIKALQQEQIKHTEKTEQRIRELSKKLYTLRGQKRLFEQEGKK